MAAWNVECYPNSAISAFGADVLSVGPFDSTCCVDHMLGQFVNVDGNIERENKSQNINSGSQTTLLVNNKASLSQHGNGSLTPSIQRKVRVS